MIPAHPIQIQSNKQQERHCIPISLFVHGKDCGCGIRFVLCVVCTCRSFVVGPEDDHDHHRHHKEADKAPEGQWEKLGEREDSSSNHDGDQHIQHLICRRWAQHLWIFGQRLYVFLGSQPPNQGACYVGRTRGLCRGKGRMYRSLRGDISKFFSGGVTRCSAETRVQRRQTTSNVQDVVPTKSDWLPRSAAQLSCFTCCTLL